MIKRVNKKCTECGREDQPWFSKKRCKSCASKSYNRPKKITEKAAKRKKGEKECLKNYFSTHLNNLKRRPFSEESGIFIPNPSIVNICHIIDKGRHKSVKCHLDNYIYLTWEEHSKMDRLLFEHKFDIFEKEFVKVFPIYVERYLKIRDCVEETTKFLLMFDSYIENNFLKE